MTFFLDGEVQTVNTLGTKEARLTWERIFNQHYIQPVLTNLDKNLTTAMDLVANDEQQGLFYFHNISHAHIIHFHSHNIFHILW